MTGARVAVLDYGMGNLRSVAKALEAAGASAQVTAEGARIDRADALCVPGQGIFGRCVDNLRGAGLDELIRDWILQSRPYLGICLGLQILFESSDEAPQAGLKVLGGRVRRLGEGVRIPHIGWNEVNGTHYYFDHSYAVDPADASIVTGWCDHGGRWAASIASGSVTATQFHPEKSGAAGVSLLRDWTRSL
jgi:glutamine amidotransferase